MGGTAFSWHCGGTWTRGCHTLQGMALDVAFLTGAVETRVEGGSEDLSRAEGAIIVVALIWAGGAAVPRHYPRVITGRLGAHLRHAGHSARLAGAGEAWCNELGLSMEDAATTVVTMVADRAALSLGLGRVMAGWWFTLQGVAT